MHRLISIRRCNGLQNPHRCNALVINVNRQQGMQLSSWNENEGSDSWLVTLPRLTTYCWISPMHWNCIINNEQPQYSTVEDADVKSYPVGTRPVSIAWECYIEFSPPHSPPTQTKKRKVVPVGRRPFSERSDRGQPRRQLHYLRHDKY